MAFVKRAARTVESDPEEWKDKTTKKKTDNTSNRANNNDSPCVINLLHQTLTRTTEITNDLLQTEAPGYALIADRQDTSFVAVCYLPRIRPAGQN